MKHFVIVVGMLAICVLSLLGCSKHGGQLESMRVYKAVIMHDASCRGFACVITKGDISSGLVDDNWKYKDKTYSNAFIVIKDCSSSIKGLKVGEEFSFRIVENNSHDCVVCALGYNIELPDRGLHIRVIK